MTLEEFENIVASAGLSSVPEKFRNRLKNVAIVIAHDVSAELRRSLKLGRGSTLLGLYQGIPLTSRGVEYGIGVTLPDQITLFMAPIVEEALQSGRDVREIVEETIWHEVAHHFGLDEHEVRRRERHKYKPG